MNGKILERKIIIKRVLYLTDCVSDYTVFSTRPDLCPFFSFIFQYSIRSPSLSSSFRSAFGDFFAVYRFLLLRPFTYLDRRIEFSIYTLSGLICFFYRLKTIISFSGATHVLINFNLSSYVSSQRWFRNARRRLNNSIRRESRGESCENQRCYVPMSQTPLTPVFIRDIPAPIRRILQLSQTKNERGSPVTPSTGELSQHLSESLREAVTCSQMATPPGANIFNMAAKSSSVADVREHVVRCPTAVHGAKVHTIFVIK